MSPSLLPLFYESFLSLQTGYFQPLPQFFTALGFRDEIRRHRSPPCFLRRSTLPEIHRLFSSQDYFSSFHNWQLELFQIQVKTFRSITNTRNVDESSLNSRSVFIFFLALTNERKFMANKFEPSAQVVASGAPENIYIYRVGGSRRGCAADFAMSPFFA